MTLRFSDHTVVVTGSARGIGAETARRFAEEGATVVVADIDGAAAERRASGIDGALGMRLDVTDHDAVQEFTRIVTDRFGAIDVLVNNAALCSPSSFLEISPADIHRDIDIALVGSIFMSQAMLPGMIAAGKGVILNLASVNGLSYFGSDVYSAAKAGVISLTKSIANEFGPAGIRCNAVAPGTVRTEAWDARLEADPHAVETASAFYPLRRIGRPADVADALLFLASDAASWITGAVLPVDGGILTGDPSLAHALTGEGQ